MDIKATGIFEVELTVGEPECGGNIQRMNWTKTFRGDLQASSTGSMFYAGDPATGYSGYIGIELVTGKLGDKHGTFALIQLGQMAVEDSQLQYEICNGSGTGDFEGISGKLGLDVDSDGVHHYMIDAKIGN